MNAYKILDFIEPHLGYTRFYGETNTDKKSNENLKNIGDLAYLLIDEMRVTLSQVDGRPEASAKMLKETIIKELEELKARIEFVLEQVEG